MEQKSVSIYHTCTVQHIKELMSLLKMMIGNNLPQTELNVTEQGAIYFKNRLAWELPLNQQSPRNEREAKEAAEYWLKEVRKREANAKTLYQHTQNKAESYLPLFFHTNWTFLKALPEYSDKNLLRYWKVIYSLKLTSIEGLPKGEARVVPDHQLVLYIKYKNPSLLPAIDYISRPIFKAEAVQSLLHFEEADIPNLRMIENAANHTISPYKMADDGNWVAMTEVGAERVKNDETELHLNDDIPEEKILALLNYYCIRLETTFTTILEDTIANEKEYAFNFFTNHTETLKPNNFLDFIKDQEIIQGAVYTSNSAAHVTPRMDGVEDAFLLGDNNKQLFLGFVHSHPDYNGLNTCFSPEDIVSHIRMGVLLYWGLLFESAKPEDVGRYFVFIVEAPTKRFALIVTNPTQVRYIYENAITNPPLDLNLELNITKNEKFSAIIKHWYYQSMLKFGVSITESSYIDAVKFVLTKLGDNTGISLYKSINEAKNIFQKV